uniref:Hv711N16.15 n=1 Tax=Hordeum vulgare TaxID=4513 RepID=Q8LLC1_HORVU|nr:hv711N16.15 [Hordeum vulgare subsp. vulgare]
MRGVRFGIVRRGSRGETAGGERRRVFNLRGQPDEQLVCGRAGGLGCHTPDPSSQPTGSEREGGREEGSERAGRGRRGGEGKERTWAVGLRSAFGGGGVFLPPGGGGGGLAQGGG